MSEYRLRPRAIADLDEIWDYTVSAWNETQAERYLLGLRDALAVLMDQPELGRARKDLHPGLRVSNYSKHLIFYLREEWHRRRARTAWQSGYRRAVQER